MNDSIKQTIAFLIPAIFLCTLLILSYMVLRDFFPTLAWALIIAYVMWPPYRWLKRRLNNRAGISASIMTAIIAVVILTVLFGFADLLRAELAYTYQNITENLKSSPLHVPAFVDDIPLLGDYIREQIERVNTDRANVAAEVLEWSRQWLGELAKFLGNLGHYAIKLGIVLVTLFFCFRDGEDSVRQVHDGLVKFLGQYQHMYLKAAGDTTRAVVYGLVLAAMAQGLLAGIGYAVADIKAPVLFGSITALLAMIPMGAVLVWLPLSLTLILSSEIWAGIGLFLWGALAVSTVDNVIRPIVISGASRVPFLIVVFGVFGGLTAFGMVGLFLGPVILAVLLSVWQSWLKQQR